MFFRRLFNEDTGSIATETALMMAVLGFVGLGVLDFGMAYSRNMQLANAARAGMQYALVRKPVDDDFSSIVDAVTVAAPSVEDTANRRISTALYCECPDGTTSECTSEGGDSIVCADGNLRSAYLEITIEEDYDLLFPLPGLDGMMHLSESTTVRLN